MKQRTVTCVVAIIACGLAVTAQAQDKLLEVPKDLKDTYRDFLKHRGSGIIKLVPREKYSRVIKIRGAGAYYSFFRHSHEYGDGSDIALQRGSFSVGFAGADYGFFVSLGDTPIEDISTKSKDLHSFSSEKQQAFDEAFNYRPPHKMEQIRQEQKRLRKPVPAVEGVTYLLRSINVTQWDLLVAIRVVKVFPDGSVALLWRGVKSWSPPLSSDHFPFYPAGTDPPIMQPGMSPGALSSSR